MGFRVQCINLDHRLHLPEVLWEHLALPRILLLRDGRIKAAQSRLLMKLILSGESFILSPLAARIELAVFADSAPRTADPCN
jgi:hypothetical protein